MYGTRDHWTRLAAAFELRVRELVESRKRWSADGRQMLCADQDILADLARGQPNLFEGFETADEWGWSNAKAALEVQPAAAVALPSCRAERPLLFGVDGPPRAVFSLLTSDLTGSRGDTYFQALRVLGASLAEHASSLPRYLMALETLHIERAPLADLAQVGWRVCSVPPIRPPHPSSEPRFRDQFAKLELLQLEQFDRVLYVDSDVLALGPVEDILNVPMRDDVHLAATRDLRGDSRGKIHWVDTFNCGVMVLRPSLPEYDRVIGLLQRDEVKYEIIMSEQGFLNEVYHGKQVARLKFTDGANLAAMTAFKREWDEARPRIRLLHYTMSKPWDCHQPYTEMCSLWLSRKAALDARTDVQQAPSWCERVASARSEVDKALHVTYPCDELPHVDSAVVTMLTDSLEDSSVTFALCNYVRGALALGMSLNQHVTRPVHRLLLVREGLKLPPESALQLKAVGWRLGTVPSISPPTLPSFVRFRSQFSKLALFGLTEYRSVLYLDADTLAVGNLDRLLDSAALFSQPQKMLAVARDFYGGKWSSTFNMGIFALRTSTSELARMHGLLRKQGVRYDVEQSEQGFMNAVYPRSGPNVVELPFEASGNSALEVREPSFWRSRLDDLAVIHFTERKPWQCKDLPQSSRSGLQSQTDASGAVQKCGDGYSAPRSKTACYCREAHRWWAALRQVKTHLDSIGFRLAEKERPGGCQ